MGRPRRGGGGRGWEEAEEGEAEAGNEKAKMKRQEKTGCGKKTVCLSDKLKRFRYREHAIHGDCQLVWDVR